MFNILIKSCMDLYLDLQFYSTDLCLFRGQYHALYIIMALNYNLKLVMVLSPVEFFLLGIVLTTQGLLCFHMN